MGAYDKHPVVEVPAPPDAVTQGWGAIRARLAAARVVAVECYPGVDVAAVERGLAGGGVQIVRAADCYLSPAALDAKLAPLLGDDPVFGRLSSIALIDFFDPAKLAAARADVAARTGRVLVIGTGATLIAPAADVVVLADMARWELQLRQRRGEIGSLGANDAGARPSQLYKRAFFVDWRAADRHKRALFATLDFILDTHAEPKLLTGDAFRAGLAAAVRRPFRVVPFFDPGPWGGQWMRKVCDLPDGPANYAWCFDCVPEENSLLLAVGDVTVEIPSIDLVFQHPRELLGEAVHARFGAEFPIRFDFLDTMGGGNLSLQVHPLTDYIRDHFGVAYTQDESYYMLDAGPDATVYLGLKEGVDRAAMRADLERAQAGGAPFPDDKHVNRWPAKKHDHFLIPGGTVHCSGANGMVLEISATPYIFTFKLWDWDRLGLDGRPRPIHLEHGLANIQWDRTTAWVERELVNRIEPIAHGPGWREERTGLHEREFLETRRHWFTGTVPHDTHGGVNVLNLVEGAEAIVESPKHAFAPFVVHFAETFILPAAVGAYTIRPHGPAIGTECATIKAYVRSRG